MESRAIFYKKLFSQVSVRYPSQPSNPPPGRILDLLHRDILKVSLNLLALTVGSHIHLRTTYGPVLDVTLEIGSAMHIQYTNVGFIIALAEVPLLVAILSYSLLNSPAQLRDASHIQLSIRSRGPSLNTRSLEAVLQPWQRMQYARPVITRDQRGWNRLRLLLLQLSTGRNRTATTILNLDTLVAACRRSLQGLKQAMIMVRAQNRISAPMSMQPRAHFNDFLALVNMISMRYIGNTPVDARPYLSESHRQAVSDLLEKRTIVGAEYQQLIVRPIPGAVETGRMAYL